MRVLFWISAILLCAVPSLASAQNRDRNTMVLNDRQRVVDDGYWIYNNLDKGFEEAKKTGKPLLVVFRCIPCEACAQLDEQVVEKNPAVRKHLSNFVCVRVVYANGMDLSRFQFDYDQSWAAFFLNADGRFTVVMELDRISTTPRTMFRWMASSIRCNRCSPCTSNSRDEIFADCQDRTKIRDRQA